MTICGEQTLVNHNATHVALATLRCKRWTCPDCFPMRLKKLKRQARDGAPRTFLTLTSRVREELSPDEAAARLVRAWRAIRKRITRRWPLVKVEFMAVFEATKQGWPHLHILARMPYVPQATLSKWMSEIDDSPIVWVEKIKNRKKAAAYVAKYISKSPAGFAGTKRYWRSLGYLEKSQQNPDLASFLPEFWVRTSAPFVKVLRNLRDQGFFGYPRNGFAILVYGGPP